MSGMSSLAVGETPAPATLPSPATVPGMLSVDGGEGKEEKRKGSAKTNRDG